jgi:hypothetical protein
MRRWCCVAALAVVIASGVLSRSAPLGWPLYDKSLGDVLYAVAAYLALALLLPRAPVGIIATLGLGACLAVEFLKLSEVNARLLTVPILHWFLGTTFSWHNIICYLLGVAGAGGLDMFLRRRSL